MSKTVAVSFEGDHVKIVHASLKGKTLSVEKTEIISDADFNYYLQKEKASEFIVTCNLRESYHDILTIPLLKSKYLGKIIESEIRKATGRKDLSFVYTLLGEKVVENRKVREVFYYAASSDEVRTIADRFYNNGKTINAIYPSVLSAASLAASIAPGEATMGVLGAGRERTVFFTRKDSIHLIRNYESLGAEFDSFDIQNINMTINYCFQNLRVNPSSVLLMGRLTGSSETGALPTVPLASLCKTENIRCTMEEFNEFIIPVSSFFAGRKSNIITREFRNIHSLRQFMSYASTAFIIIAAISVLFVLYEINNISAQRHVIDQARRGMADMEHVASEYNKREDDIRRYRSVVEFLNRSAPSLRGLLVTIAETGNKEFIFNHLEAKALGDDAFSVSINGTCFVDTYASMQALIKNLTDQLNTYSGVTVIDQAMDLQSRTFRITMEYRGAS